MRYLSALLVGHLITAPFLAKAETNPDAARIFAELERRTARAIGVAAVDPAKNRRIEYHAQERFLMCSTFKVLAVAAVLKRVDEKKEKLERFVRYTESQLLEYAPVTRQHVKERGMTLDALCAAAITQSDNTAANLLLESIGGPKGWTEFARSLGDNSSRLDRMEPDLNTAIMPGDDRDTTTPAAMAADLQRLFTSDVLSEESRTRLENWMIANQTGSKMIRASVPADWQVGDKNGRSGKGQANDNSILRRPNGGAPFFVIFVVASKGTSGRGGAPVGG